MASINNRAGLINENGKRVVSTSPSPNGNNHDGNNNSNKRFKSDEFSNEDIRSALGRLDALEKAYASLQQVFHNNIFFPYNLPSYSF